MANKKAAIKDILRNKRNRLRNVHFKTILKTSLKKADEAIEAGKKKEDVQEIVRVTLKTIDKTASKGIIKKNSASRRKSKLMKRFNALK